jgi:hypothetical protein
MKRITLLVIALLPIALPARAQDHVFSPGGLLRIEAPNVFPGRMEAVVRAYTHEGLHLESPNGRENYVLSPTEIRYLAKYRGPDRRYMVKQRAATLGFVGGSIGAVSGPFIAIGLERGTLSKGSAIGAATGAVLGSAAGAIWGSRHRGDVWREYRIIGYGRQPRTP